MHDKNQRSFEGSECHSCGTGWNKNLIFREVKEYSGGYPKETDPFMPICELCYKTYVGPLLKFEHYSQHAPIARGIATVGNMLLTEIRKQRQQ